LTHPADSAGSAGLPSPGVPVPRPESGSSRREAPVGATRPQPPARYGYPLLATYGQRVGGFLIDIGIPAMPHGARTAFLEVARRHGDFALLGVAAVIAHDASGNCSHARLAYVNAGSTPVRARRAEAVLVGSDLGPEAVDNAVDVMLEEIDPPTDVHATSAYRRQLARVLTRRAVSVS
jgi:CO/xanthine dehydrogenase FAD-binding subunit